MEPMALGSAPSSPSSPGVNPNFLPSFLLGDQQTSASPCLSSSPGRIQINSGSSIYRSLKSGTNATDTRNLRQKLFSQTNSESPTSACHSSLVLEKVGPPKVGLFDTVDSCKKSGVPFSDRLNSADTSIYQDYIPQQSNDSSNVKSIIDDSFNRSSGVNFNQCSFSKIDTNWVTVFGFLPSTINLVMSELSKCGAIVEKRMPASGNWFHVRFNNPNEVAKAMALNGKCINDSVMIGVSLHYDKNLEGKENQHSYISPIHARPLRYSYKSPNTSLNNVIVPQNVPQKSTGLVTKAMEYVFGW